MTTHYQKIQALGNRMAENLTIMGVPSQFDEGGLTLADKILEISGRVTSGIILYADKKIAQSGDTANLYALVLNDNIAVSGETVRFYSDIHLRSETCSQSDSLYDDYYTSSSKSGVQYDFIGSNDKYIRYNSTTINIFYGSQWSSDFRYTGEFHIKEGVLTYYDSGGVSHTVDVSMVDTTSINSNPITVYYNWVEVTTEDDGVATYEYDCTGSGLREFYATSGTFVSEIYEVFDCLKYDDDVTPVADSIWELGNNGNAQLTRQNGYSNLSEIEIRSDADAWCLTQIVHSCAIEFDAQVICTGYTASFCQLGQSANATTILQIALSNFNISDNNWHHFKFTINGDGKLLTYIDNSSTPITLNMASTYDPSGSLYFRFRTSGPAITEINFKGFKVYSI